MQQVDDSAYHRSMGGNAAQPIRIGALCFQRAAFLVS